MTSAMDSVTSTNSSSFGFPNEIEDSISMRKCPVCAQQGHDNVLNIFQINLEEAIYMCQNTECPYPIGKNDSISQVFPRDAFKIPTSVRNSQQSTSSPSVFPFTSPDLQQAGATLTDNNISLSSHTTVSVPEDSFSHQPSDKQVDIISDHNLPLRNKSKKCDENTEDLLAPPTCIDQTFSELFDFDSDFFDSLPDNFTAMDNEDHESHRVNEIHPQWVNKDALCWLDVSMCILVHSNIFRNAIDSLSKYSVVYKLLVGYLKADTLLNDKIDKLASFETSVGTVMVKTGGGSTPTRPTSKRSSPSKCLPNTHAQNKINLQPIESSKKESETCKILENIRDMVWNSIYPKLKCEKGDNDSPVFALPLIVDLDKDILRYSNVKYTWKMVCCHCGYQHEDRVTRVMPTFPNSPSDFSMLAPCFIRDCIRCKAKRQRMNMIFNVLPPVTMVHFVKGLPEMSFSDLDFDFRGDEYKVKSVVQYKNNPDHFVCWIRHHDGQQWMECDDTKEFKCSYQPITPSFPKSQVHIVCWEKQGNAKLPLDTHPDQAINSKGQESQPFMTASGVQEPAKLSQPFSTSQVLCLSTQSLSKTPFSQSLILPPSNSSNLSMLSNFKQNITSRKNLKGNVPVQSASSVANNMNRLDLLREKFASMKQGTFSKNQTAKPKSKHSASSTETSVLSALQPFLSTLKPTGGMHSKSKFAAYKLGQTELVKDENGKRKQGMTNPPKKSVTFAGLTVGHNNDQSTSVNEAFLCNRNNQEVSVLRQEKRKSSDHLTNVLSETKRSRPSSPRTSLSPVSTPIEIFSTSGLLPQSNPPSSSSSFYNSGHNPGEKESIKQDQMLDMPDFLL